MSTVLKVPAAAWSGGKPRHCYDNVADIIRQRGGEPVFGWALAECGPLTTSGWYPPPLYRRWVNHVVWRDTCGNLWEVSPSVTIEHDDNIVFQDTEFVIDPSAMMGRATPQEWFRTGIRYVPVRKEGEEVAKYLTLAQGAQRRDELAEAIQKAVNAVGVAGFQPTKVIVQNIEGNTSSIWIYAD